MSNIYYYCVLQDFDYMTKKVLFHYNRYFIYKRILFIALFSLFLDTVLLIYTSSIFYNDQALFFYKTSFQNSKNSVIYFSKTK